MSDITCDAVRGALPDWTEGRLAGSEAARIEDHIESCPACRRQVEFIRIVSSARPRVPEGLDERILSALRSGGLGVSPGASRDGGTGAGHRAWFRGVSVGGGRSGWGLAAAAAVVLALGTAVIWPQVRQPEPLMPELAVGDPWLLPDGLVSDQGIVAGAPVLEALSDEELLTLLEELGG